MSYDRPSSSCRYSEDQVLRGIQAFVTEECGDVVILAPDKPLMDYEQVVRDSHECPLLFLEDLASYFGLVWRETRWIAWLKLQDSSTRSKQEKAVAWDRWKRDVSPQLTVRALASHIARHAKGQSLEPATILGHTCDKAGVFLGIRQMQEVRGLRVAPSTPLCVLMSSARIRALWHRVQWVAGVSLPPASEPSPSRLATWCDWLALASWVMSLIVAGVVGVSIADKRGDIYIAAIGAFACWLLALLVGYKIVDRVHNPLPSGITSFGDLARLVASLRTS